MSPPPIALPTEELMNENMKIKKCMARANAHGPIEMSICITMLEVICELEF
jgi:hypothetical protein